MAILRAVFQATSLRAEWIWTGVRILSTPESSTASPSYAARQLNRLNLLMFYLLVCSHLHNSSTRHDFGILTTPQNGELKLGLSLRDAFMGGTILRESHRSITYYGFDNSKADCPRTDTM